MSMTEGLPYSIKRLRSALRDCASPSEALQLVKRFKGCSLADALVQCDASHPGFVAALLDNRIQAKKYVQELVDAWNDSEEEYYRGLLIRVARLELGLEIVLESKRVSVLLLESIVEDMLLGNSSFAIDEHDPKLTMLIKTLSCPSLSVLIIRSIAASEGFNVCPSAQSLIILSMRHWGSDFLALWKSELKTALAARTDSEDSIRNIVTVLRSIQHGLLYDREKTNSQYAAVLAEVATPLSSSAITARIWLEALIRLVSTDPAWALQAHKKCITGLKQSTLKSKYLTLLREQIGDPAREDRLEAKNLVNHLIRELSDSSGDLDKLSEMTRKSMVSMPKRFKDHVLPLLQGHLDPVVVDRLEWLVKQSEESTVEAFGDETDETLADVCKRLVEAVNRELEALNHGPKPSSSNSEIDTIARLQNYLKTFAALAEKPDASVVDCGVRLALCRSNQQSPRLKDLQGLFLRVDPHVRTPVLKSLAWNILCSQDSSNNGKIVLDVLMRQDDKDAIISSFFSFLAQAAAGASLDQSFTALSLYAHCRRMKCSIVCRAMKWLRERITFTNRNLVHPALDEFDGFCEDSDSMFPSLEEFMKLECSTSAKSSSLNAVQFCTDVLLNRYEFKSGVILSRSIRCLIDCKGKEPPVHLVMAIHLAMQRTLTFDDAVHSFLNAWVECAKNIDADNGGYEVAYRAFSLAQIIFPDLGSLCRENSEVSKMLCTGLRHPLPEHLLAIVPIEVLENNQM